jgi:hypothetical protein
MELFCIYATPLFVHTLVSTVWVLEVDFGTQPWFINLINRFFSVLRPIKQLHSSIRILVKLNFCCYWPEEGTRRIKDVTENQGMYVGLFVYNVSGWVMQDYQAETEHPL